MSRDLLSIAFCPGCAHRISKKAHTCDNCGYEWEKHPSTIRDLLEGNHLDYGYNNANVDLFVYTIFQYLLKHKFLYETPEGEIDLMEFQFLDQGGGVDG